MRVKTLVRILTAGFVFLLSGLIYIQVIRHDTYRVMSEENRLRVTPLMAPRGAIHDRKGRVMVRDVLSFNASVTYNQIKDLDALKKVLCAVLDIPEDEIDERIKESRERRYSPVLVAADIGTKGAIQLEEIGSEYPGLLLEVSTKREYLNGKNSANILGYLGLINRSEFKRLRHYGYRLNDFVGRDGIEKKYDNYLRGIHGGKQVEADHLGREMSTLGYKEPVPGRDLYLTIDLDLQKFCDGLLKGKRGAIVAMDPATGAILAMASAPAYDPEIFIDRKRSGEIKTLLEDEEYPLINRAISGKYPLGSVFKVVVATGALETKKASPETSAVCNGVFKLGRATFHCWKAKGHGEQKMIDAIKNSCNVYFYRLGLILGVDDIANSAQKFGFGKLTGVDLPGEAAGIVPTRKWKKNRFNERWYKGETVSYSIGQGYLLVTPLQVARMISVFANNGYLVTPHLVKTIGSVSIDEYEKKSTGISARSLDTVKQGMRKCVNDRRGTGMKAKLDDVVVSGKTGTAQTSRGKSHGWFAGFAPLDNTKLTIVVFDEYGGKGGYYAAETGGKVFKEAARLGII